MRFLVLMVLCLPALAMPVQALELVVNGGFEEELSVGWTSEGWGGAGYAFRSTTLDPDPDYEAMVRKTTGAGCYRLHQFIALPSTDVEFSCAARITVSATSTAWASGAVSLAYTDQNGLVLGETSILAHTYHYPMIDNPTRHVIPVWDTDWHTYTFNLADELENLPGVDPLSVWGVRIALLGSAGDC